jgi:hypothetical protein
MNKFIFAVFLLFVPSLGAQVQIGKGVQIGGLSAIADPANLNGFLYVNQWCTTPGTLDDTCFSNAIANVVAHGPVGNSSRKMGELVVSPGVYTFNNTVTVPLGINISIQGAQDSLWGSVIKAGSSHPNLFTVLADSVTIQNITFIGDVGEDAIVLGSSTNALYDTHINWCWFNSFSRAIHIINGGGLDLSHNTFEYNTFGIASIYSSGDVRANDIIATDLRGYRNSNGAVNLTGDTTAANYGNNQFSGIFDYNGGSGYPQITLYGVTDTQVSGNFNNGYQDDLLVAGVSRNILVGPIVANNSGRNTIAANSVTGLTVANVSAHNTNVTSAAGITAVVNATNIILLTVTGVTSNGTGLAAYGIYVDAASTLVDVYGNQLYAQVTAAYDVLSATSTTGGTNVMNYLTLENDATSGDTTIGVFGQINVTNPKQLYLKMSPATNTLSLQGSQSGVGYNQTLALNPLGGPVTSGGLFGAAAGVNLSGADAPLEFAGDPGTSGQVPISGGTGGTPHWGAGGSGISGLTAGFIPLAGSGTTITANSPMDYGVTTANVITSTKPIAITGTTHGFTIAAGTAATGAAGSVVYASDSTNGYGEINENNTGLSRLCTATNGICDSGGISNVTITTGTGAVSATCASNSLSSAVTMTGLATTNTLTFTPSTDVSSVTGWDTGELFIVPVLGSGSFTWRLCTANPSGTTPGGSVTWNASAK